MNNAAAAACQFSAAFTADLGSAAAPPEALASLLGLEHEYSLVRNDQRVDFRQIIHGLSVPGRRLDPGDLNAYRSPSGLALTCDDAEAEVACPPVDVRPGFARAIDDWAITGRAELRSVLPPGIELGGYSTHLSASMPAALNDRACQLFARTFAPVLSLLVDGPDSFGVYVRPRPNRLEFCGEFVTGPRLTAASAFVAGAARACADAASGDEKAIRRLPPILAVRLLPSLGRYGLYVGRNSAFGFDLYGAGRRARLPRKGGGTITAQEQLELAWAAASNSLTESADAGDLEVARSIVEGSRPLGIEERAPADAGEDGRRQHSAVYGGVVVPRDRPGFGVAAAILTWGFSVFQVDGRGRRAFACIPRDSLAVFLDRLDAGTLDEAIGRYLASPPTGRVLSSHGETREPGLWDEVGNNRDLLPPERQPAESSGASGSGQAVRAGKFARPGKVGRPGKVLLPLQPVVPPPLAPPPPPTAPPPKPKPAGKGPPWKIILPVGVILAVILIGIGVILGGGSGGGEESTPTATASSTPVPTSTIPVVVPTERATATPTGTPSAAPTGSPSPTATLEPSPSPTPIATAGVVCDLTIAKTSLPNVPGRGTISYEIRVGWVCPPGVAADTPTTVHVDDALPVNPNVGVFNGPQVASTSATSGAIGCAGPPHPHPGAPGFDDNRFGCDVGILPANGSAVITVVLDTGGRETLTNTAVVDTDNAVPESDEGNNQTQITDLDCCQ